MIVNPPSFYEWQRMAVSEGYAVRSVTAGMAGQPMYHAISEGKGSVGLWNLAGNTGYIEVSTGATHNE